MWLSFSAINRPKKSFDDSYMIENTSLLLKVKVEVGKIQLTLKFNQ